MANTKPYIAAALLCERVLQENDGVLTAVRIVETFTVTTPVSFSPGQAHAVVLPSTEFAVLISLKSGDLHGRFRVALQLQSPSGKIQSVGEETPVLLEGGEQGVNIVTKLTLKYDEYGVYWFDVFWEGEVLTRIPFKVVEAAADAGRTDSPHATPRGGFMSGPGSLN